MIRIQQLKVPVEHEKKDIEHKIRKILRLKPKQRFTFRIWKQSIDARRKNEIAYVYTVDVNIEYLDCNHKSDFNDLAASKQKEKSKKHLSKCSQKDAALAESFVKNSEEGLLTESLFKKLEEKIVRRAHNKDVMMAAEKKYRFPEIGQTALKFRPIIVGSGPAGLFCAYLLAMHGYQPIILERGKEVSERKKDVEKFWRDGCLNPSSNVQFGEGGAGTFSDGKLNTLVKDAVGRNRFVLEAFVQFGADDDILYINKPHIGTDRLVLVVENMRKEIQRLGGTFYFETCLTDLHIQDGRLLSVTVTAEGKTQQIKTELLVLAVGHSARDTFEMLWRSQLPMEAKPFAVGMRVEHPQKMINLHQYKGADMHKLPVASYKVTASSCGQRGVYSFCMCPGGYVVNASSQEGHLAVNGMSYHDRGGSNANSAVIVAVTPEDFISKSFMQSDSLQKENTPLSGIAFQRELESRAYTLGKGRIPQQLYGDYKAGKPSTEYGDFASQTRGSCAFADLSGLLPHSLKEAFIGGMERFADYIPGFNRYDAVLSGVESRTSSPVRILRNEQGESVIKGIYPCGEGAGYAGGIMSAAMDGIKTAELIGARFKPC